MSDATAFLAAIHAAPEDAAPRLVYADWLDEHGQPGRADLIRRMCRVPTYVFTWSRRARHGRHVHAESVGAIRGLRGRAETVYRDEWARLPGVELIQVCRGFIEYIDIRALPFLAHAGDIFARHPIVAVGLCGLHTWMSASRPGEYEGVLQPGRSDDRHWPLELFPEYAAGTSVFYADHDMLILDLSRRAAGYGRRMAGVFREPPPLPRPRSIGDTDAPRRPTRP
ncbi:MAG TPA: TIGR02996 domain-containing protein [Gemmataceae bacterium]|nr:TIGR02996 domain-containing protein [Gemmataceae bacterium]